MKLAILGGVNTIEHGSFMSEETMELMVEKNCYLIPTISAGKQVAEKAKQPGFFPEVVARKALEIGPIHQSTMEHELGKIEAGFIADIIAVEDNPNDNVSTLENVSFVMKEGVIYKQ